MSATNPPGVMVPRSARESKAAKTLRTTRLDLIPLRSCPQLARKNSALVLTASGRTRARPKQGVKRADACCDAEHENWRDEQRTFAPRSLYRTRAPRSAHDELSEPLFSGQLSVAKFEK
jgi:hypothetical protein